MQTGFQRAWRGCPVVGVRVVFRAPMRPGRRPQSESRLSRAKPGFLHALAHHGVAEADREHAAARGCARVPPTGITSSVGGGAHTDALLAGGVDILTRTGSCCCGWVRIPAAVSTGHLSSPPRAPPMTLITVDANIKSIRDFGPNDKIRGATVSCSTQRSCCRSRRLLRLRPTNGRSSMRIRCSFAIPTPSGDDHAQHEVPPHVAIPPFYVPRQTNWPRAHVVLSSPTIMGGPLTGPSSSHDQVRRAIRRSSVVVRRHQEAQISSQRHHGGGGNLQESPATRPASRISWRG